MCFLPVVFFLNRLRGELYLNGWQYPCSFPYRLSVTAQVGGFLYANKKKEVIGLWHLMRNWIYF